MDRVKTKSKIQKYTLRICDCDLAGQWKPSSIVIAIQETSGAHCEYLGLGSSALLKVNACWIITHSEVYMDRYPRLWDTVTVESIPNGTRRWFLPRNCIFTDVNGERLGYSSTNWAILDISKRQIIPPGRFSDCLPDNSDVDFPLAYPRMVEAVTGEETILTRTPLYSDLDLNGHLTNARYVDWVCDALGIEVMRDYCLESIRVNYGSEIKAGQEITLKVIRDGLRYLVSGYHDGKRHFEMGGGLRKRDTGLEAPDEVNITDPM